MRTDYGTVLFQSKVFVALPEEAGESILSWVLEHASSSAEIILIHIKQTQRGTVGRQEEQYKDRCDELEAELGRTQAQESAVKELAQSQSTPFDHYLHQCAKSEVKAQILAFEELDVAEGIIKIVDKLWIRTLVMGAASDKHYSKNMKVPGSKKARKLMENAHPFCEIWFICNRKLIFTRFLSVSLPQYINPDEKKSVSIYIDADEGFWDVENLEAESYLVDQQKDNSEMVSGQADVALDLEVIHDQRHSAMQNDELHYAGGKVNEPHERRIEMIAPTLQASAVREIEMLHQQMQNKEWSNISKEVASLTIERDAAMRKIKLLKKQKKQMMAEWNFSMKQLVELRKLDHVVIELMAARRDKLLLMSERDSTSEVAKELTTRLEGVISERDNAVRQMAELRETLESVQSSQLTDAELQRATQDFDDRFQIGLGGSAVVYKGFLRNTDVAIKRLKPKSGPRSHSEFNQEVTILSRVRHPNIITLVGTCPDVRALVYEFMPNGSLEDHLARKAGAPPLPWQARTRIVTEICSALSFLHRSKPNAIVHGDIKPANILLDRNLVSKLSDFGMSRFLNCSDGEGAMYCTSQPWGTMGYMDPEFHTTGELTLQTDTYSFGVTLLRVLTARSPVNLQRVVREALEKGDLAAVMDTSAGEWPTTLAKHLATLALRCTDRTREMRPDLAGEVWSVLKRLADEAAGEAPAGSSSSRQQGVGTSVPLNRKHVTVAEYSPAHPCKCLSGIKIQIRR